VAQRNADADVVFRALADLTGRRARVTTPFLDQLDAMAAPDRDQIKGWIAGLREQTAMLAQLAGAYARHDTGAVARLSEREDALSQRDDAFAGAYGMRTCAAAF
jgi:hypothetical protein